MLKTLFVVVAACAVFLGGCGGHGGSSTPTPAAGGSAGGSGTTPPPAPPALANFTTVSVDAGPVSSVLEGNIPYVSVTLCAPGTSVCQTIDHVELDTGSEGLRIEHEAMGAPLLAALPTATDASAHSVGECYGFVDGYVFGSVRNADFKIGGETVANMPLQVIGDTGAFATIPSSCSSIGGKNLATVKALGSNGVLGVGTQPTDCGAGCATAGGQNGAAATYYDCPGAGCSAVIARASTTTAPFEQVPNPVAAMAVDNNGSILVMPSVPDAGQVSAIGTLYFGIGTQTNNALGSVTVLATSTSTSSQGTGLITATYNGATLPNSFIDSGTNFYLFVDTAIPLCTDKSVKQFYCPTSSMSLTPTLQGLNGAMASGAFTLNNALTALSSNHSAVPGVGVNTSAANLANPYTASFGFGFPFFYGRKVYTAIEGRATGGGLSGPYYAF